MNLPSTELLAHVDKHEPYKQGPHAYLPEISGPLFQEHFQDAGHTLGKEEVGDPLEDEGQPESDEKKGKIDLHGSSPDVLDHRAAVLYEKMLQAVVFCTFQPRRPAWFHMVRGFEAKVPFLSSEAKILQGSNTQPLALSGLCRHGTCARRPGRNVIFSCLVVPTQA